MAAVGHDKHLPGKEVVEPHGSGSDIVDEEVGVVQKSSSLSRDLKNRHMQSKSSTRSLPVNHVFDDGSCTRLLLYSENPSASCGRLLGQSMWKDGFVFVVR